MSIKAISEVALRYATDGERKQLNDFIARANAQEAAATGIRPCGLPGVLDLPGRITGQTISAAHDDALARRLEFWRAQRALALDGNSKLIPLARSILERTLKAKDSPQKKLEAEKSRLSAELNRLGFDVTDVLLSAHPTVRELKKESDSLTANERNLRSGNPTAAFLKEADDASRMISTSFKEAGLSQLQYA